jgi:hypothetical protein
MKKLLLILAITFVGLVDAQEIKNPYIIEKLWLGDIICIHNYVFIRATGGSITQLMREGMKEASMVPMQPMKCSEYKKTG